MTTTIITALLVMTLIGILLLVLMIASMIIGEKFDRGLEFFGQELSYIFAMGALIATGLEFTLLIFVSIAKLVGVI